MVAGLFFVTGISGAGKSTVREELNRRGVRAYDTDEDEIAQWTHKVTGVVTPLLADAHRTPEFLEQNIWRADPDRVRELAREAEQQPVFLCGSVGNDDEVWDLFAKVFLLSIDESTMRRRLATRTAHDFGQRPHELELVLAWGTVIEAYYEGRGAITVDATQSPAAVVDRILAVLQVPNEVTSSD